MSVFNDIMKRVSGSPDDITSLAEKVGISPDQAEQAVAALGQAHQMEGDTVELAASKTGIDKGVMATIVEQVGGEGSLMEYAREIASNPAGFKDIFMKFDADGDGNPLNDMADKAKGFFKKD